MAVKTHAFGCDVRLVRQVMRCFAHTGVVTVLLEGAVCLVSAQAPAPEPAASPSSEQPQSANAELQAEGERLFGEGKAADEATKYERAAELFQQAAEVFDRAPNPVDAAWIYSWLSKAYAALARHDAAREAQTECVRRMRAALGDAHPDTLGSINDMGFLLHSQGKLSEAEPYFGEALETFRRVLGDEHSDTLTSISNMGMLLESQGKLSEAEPYFREALQTRRRVLGDAHPSTLTSINNMGGLLKSQGKLSEAVPYFREALQTCRRVLGDEHPSTLNLINNMGTLLDSQGKLSEAEPYCREALQTRRRVLGDAHPSTLNSINSMGGLLYSQGKLSEAEPYVREALQARRRVLGDDHPDTLRSINSMGALLKSQGELSEAEPYYREALQTRRRVLGDEHSDTLTSISNMGGLLYSQGKLSEAEPYVREALQTRRRMLGDDHPDTLRSINNKGALLKSQGMLREAEPYFREALETSRRVLGDAHSDTLTSINNMGMLFESQGKLSEAEPYVREALQTRRRVLGDAHLDTLSSINNMGYLLESQGRLSEAEPYFREALETGRQVLGDAHPDTLRSINNMGMLLESQGKLSEAEPFVREALQSRRRVLGDAHPSTLSSISNMGVLLSSQGKLSEAEPYYREALETGRRVLGDAHPSTLSSINNMGVLLSSQGKQREAEPYVREAAEHAERIGHTDLHIFATNLANVLFRQGDLSKAAACLTKAIAQIEDFRGQAKSMTVEDRAIYFTRLKRGDSYELMVDVQLALAEAALEANDEAQAHEHEDRALKYLEQSLARAALDLLEAGRVDLAAEAAERAKKDAKLEVEHGTVEKRYGDALRAVASLDHQLAWWRNNLNASRAERKAQIDALLAQRKSARNALKTALGERQRLWARILGDVMKLGEPTSPSELRGLLGENERLMYYLVDNQNSRALLVARDGSPQLVTLRWPDGIKVKEDDLTAAVDRYRQGLIADGHRQQRAATASALAAARSANDASRVAVLGARLRVLDIKVRASLEVGGADEDLKLKELLAEGPRLFAALMPKALWTELKTCQRVYLVPNAVALNRLPLEALVVTDAASAAARQYWLDVGPELVYGASGSFFVRARADWQQHRDHRRELEIALLVGDPIFTAPQLPRTGVLITHVNVAGVAGKVGLEQGDVLLTWNGARLASVADLDTMLSAHRSSATQPVELIYTRPTLRTQRAVLLPPSIAALGIRVAPIPPRRYADQLGRTESGRLIASLNRGLQARHGHLRRLPGTRKEVGAIFKVLTDQPLPEDDPTAAAAGTSVLLQGAATERALHRRFEAVDSSVRLLHLATHGLADVTDNQSYSSIALTLPAIQTEEDNGFLDLRDLITRWRGLLQGCELVVLSACNTQVGPQQRGEAVFALPLGFRYAGATAIIASLWQVDDAATAELMSSFYAETLATQGSTVRPKATMFWQARKTLRKQYAEPFFWAPFIYIGETR